LGLADPNSPDAAVSLDAARATTMSYATATGTAILAADLDPAPAAYSPGMAITIVPSESNAAEAMVDLNGLGAVPIVKWGAVPLDSGDLRAGMPARLVYDGTRFLLVSTTYLRCPDGFKPVGPRLCINESDQGPGTFFEAVQYCSGINARLCTFNEWTEACREDPAFVPNMIEASPGNWAAGEWVDSAANNAGDAKRMGIGSNGLVVVDELSCVAGATTLPTVTARVRCCRNR
jgi:hypothetical protein